LFTLNGPVLAVIASLRITRLVLASIAPRSPAVPVVAKPSKSSNVRCSSAAEFCVSVARSSRPHYLSLVYLK